MDDWCPHYPLDILLLGCIFGLLQRECSTLHIACKDGRQEIVHLILEAAKKQNLHKLEPVSADLNSDCDWIINTHCRIKVTCMLR